MTRHEADGAVHAEQHMRYDALVGAVDDLHGTVARLAHGAFKPIEVPGTPKAERERRNPSATAHEMGADVQRMTRVARWRDAATVQVVEYPDREHVDGLIGREEGGAARETAEQLRADGLPE
jgi:hypothetical protein